MDFQQATRSHEHWMRSCTNDRDRDFAIKKIEKERNEDAMALDQVENPPEHADVAPAGEIRNEPRRVLRLFTFVIVIALILPVVGLVAVGITAGRMELSAIGLGMIAVLGISFSITLWKIISSRTNARRRLE